LTVLSDAELHPVRIPLRVPFRRVSWRDAVLVEGSEGWGEFSPFPEYPPETTVKWLAAALESACRPWPQARRTTIELNTTIPAVAADEAARLTRDSGCSTAKVKVGEPGQDFAQDVSRVEAVRDALGPTGAIRLDVNGTWTVDEAEARVGDLAEFDLEYVEQPVATIEELLELRRRISVPLAGDEVIRLAADPMEAVERGAVDIAVLKVQPMGGIRPLVSFAERAGVPVVVSSAIDTSIGLASGLAAAAALPRLEHACGLGTGPLLAGDVVLDPVVPVRGAASVRRVQPHPDLLERWRPERRVAGALMRRLRQAAELLT